MPPGRAADVGQGLLRDMQGVCDLCGDDVYASEEVPGPPRALRRRLRADAQPHAAAAPVCAPPCARSMAAARRALPANTADLRGARVHPGLPLRAVPPGLPRALPQVVPVPVVSGAARRVHTLRSACGLPQRRLRQELGQPPLRACVCCSPTTASTRCRRPVLVPPGAARPALPAPGAHPGALASPRPARARCEVAAQMLGAAPLEPSALQPAEGARQRRGSCRHHRLLGPEAQRAVAWITRGTPDWPPTPQIEKVHNIVPKRMGKVSKGPHQFGSVALGSALAPGARS
jgi:hypothetical protein